MLLTAANSTENLISHRLKARATFANHETSEARTQMRRLAGIMLRCSVAPPQVTHQVTDLSFAERIQ
jgi:hypothetical protein